MTKTMLDAVIVGAGPYGLSIAAHFRHRGISFRIFGRPMENWLTRMPEGMMLKSDGFASDLYDPRREFTLKHFCAERGIEYADVGIPVKLNTFTAYGLAFQKRMVPMLENKMVAEIERMAEGFRVRLADGEILSARKVVMAVGITNFDYIPPVLADLPPKFLTHSKCHQRVDTYSGRQVLVVGGGSSAMDLAGLMHQAGVDVQLVSRRKALIFHSGPMTSRSWWDVVRHPRSGLGPGLRLKFFSDAPRVFYHLPQDMRVDLVRKTLGPSGGWFMKEMVLGKVPLLLGHTAEAAEVRDGMVRLRLRAADGTTKEVAAEHIVAATGYRVDLDRLTLLSENIRSNIRRVEGSPALSSKMESSVPGLYFVGVAAANSFGPLMRFAYGAGFAARQVTKALAKSLAREREGVMSSAFVPDEVEAAR